MTSLTICLIICVLTMISYVWGKLPMGLTALTSMAAFILTGCLDPKTALGYFGNSNGVMIVAMFVVAAGFTRTQFVKKAAASVNKIAHGSLTMVMLGYVLVTALLAQFIQSSVIVFGHHGSHDDCHLRRVENQPVQDPVPSVHRQHLHHLCPAPGAAALLRPPNSTAIWRPTPTPILL